MNWLLWRQYQKQFLIAGIGLLLFAAFMVPTGISMSHTYHQALITCKQTSSCSDLSNVLFQNDRLLFDLVVIIGVGVPFLLGLFWGVPLIAKDYEEGTNKLVWTQSCTRRAWVTSRLCWMLVAAALYGAAMAVLTTWWSRTGNALQQDRFLPMNFDAQGFMPVVYAVFAVALGAAMGAWLKRVLLALAATLGVLVLVQAIVPNFVRPHYMTPLTRTSNVQDDPTPSGSIWVLQSTATTAQGVAVTDILAQTPDACKSIPRTDNTKNVSEFFACLSSLGYKRSVTYQPADRYWKFQDIEAGIYLVLSALLIGVTYPLVLRRDA